MAAIMTGAFGQWLPDRPNTLVIACSDGRLQEATDEFLAHHLQVTRYDRFYVPGGAGALAASGRDFLRAQQIRRECRYLVELQEQDAEELRGRCDEWAGAAAVAIYQCEVD